METKTMYQATTMAPVNIAVVKYWGKRDASLNLPTNSSISVTLSQSDLRTVTTALTDISAEVAPDTLLLNGAEQDTSGARLQGCFRELRSFRHQLEEENADLPKLSRLPLRIVSENNFPTAAGLASSAAGLAALVRAVADLYKLPQDPTILSRIARLGSGSACRSLFGGYVAWNMGERLDGSDSIAVQLAPASHWPEMCAIILVVSASKKDVSSTSGMQRTVATSELFQARAETVVPRSIKQMEKAIHDKDFEAFGNITMRESNSFHATCLDTTPPIFYLNDVSRAAMKVVERINSAAGKIIAAYTFDAGPNAVIFYEKKNSKAVSERIQGILEGVGEESVDDIDEVTVSLLRKGVSRVISTSVGEGPTPTESLIK